LQDRQAVSVLSGIVPPHEKPAVPILIYFTDMGWRAIDSIPGIWVKFTGTEHYRASKMIPRRWTFPPYHRLLNDKMLAVLTGH
jgi:hypothetical protein